MPHPLLLLLVAGCYAAPTEDGSAWLFGAAAAAKGTVTTGSAVVRFSRSQLGDRCGARVSIFLNP